MRKSLIFEKEDGKKNRDNLKVKQIFKGLFSLQWAVQIILKYTLQTN